MTDNQINRRGRRRVLVITAVFSVGALVGAGLLAGFGGFGSSAATAAAPAAQVTPVSSSAVARTTSQFDAQTIYEQDSPGVVDITVTETSSQGSGGGLDPFQPSGSGQAQAEGTGFVYDKSGDIITADHVVSGASKITVRFRDGTSAKATLVGADPSSDTAVIRVSVPASALTPIALADSSAVTPGQGVVAIGSPFGYAGSITAGIVSAVGRDIQSPNGYTIPDAIQTDAAINHGNSGGPLIDSTGKVIGINVQIADDGAGGNDNAGVGFAVPSSAVKTVVGDLVAGRPVQHPYLGVAVGDPASGGGAQIGTVRAGGPAAAAGLKAGDVITAVNGTKIAGADQLTGIVSQHKPGDKIRLTVTRNGSTLTIEVTLGTRPATSTT